MEQQSKFNYIISAFNKVGKVWGIHKQHLERTNNDSALCILVTAIMFTLCMEKSISLLQQYTGLHDRPYYLPNNPTGVFNQRDWVIIQLLWQTLSKALDPSCRRFGCSCCYADSEGVF